MALFQFKNTALALAQTGIGDDDALGEVIGMVLGILESDVIDAINASHILDQAAVNSAMATFIASINAIYNNAVTTLDEWEATTEELKNHTIECVRTEETICFDCLRCIDSCHNQTVNCDEAFLDLKDAWYNVTTIVDSYCEAENEPAIVPALETTSPQLVPVNHAEQMAKMAAYDVAYKAWLECTELSLPCTVNKDCALTELCHEPDNGHPMNGNECICQNYTTVRDECQSDRELRADYQCLGHTQHDSLNTAYILHFNQQTTHYYSIIEGTDLRESDRKVEWDTVSRAICLLNTLLYDRATNSTGDDGWQSRDNGTANKEAVEECESQFLDASWLDIIYPALPSMQSIPPFDSPCSQNYISTVVTSSCFVDGTASSEPEQVADCVCVTEGRRDDYSGLLHFPNEYGPFFKMHEAFILNSDLPNGIKIEDNMWHVTGTNLEVYSGVLVLDASSSVLFAYPDANTHPDTPPNVQFGADFILHGGLIYRDGDSVTEVKELLPVDYGLSAAIPADKILALEPVLPPSTPCSFVDIPTYFAIHQVVTKWCWDPSFHGFQFRTEDVSTVYAFKTVSGLD